MISNETALRERRAMALFFACLSGVSAIAVAVLPAFALT
jgi:hypothetical protein